MPLRQTPSSGIIVTGANGGLGQALVFEYAGPDVHFLLLGRDCAGLDALAVKARNKGAEVTCLACSGTDRTAIAVEIAEFDKRSPINLLICAAGTKTFNTSGIENFDRFENVIDTNLIFPAFVTQCVLPPMKARRDGQIVLISSLAAIAPHADLISYSASKAGLSAYAIALRRSLGRLPVGITLVQPGFIDTPMTENHIGPTPMCVSANWAARRIRRGIERRRPFVTFPMPLIILTRFWNFLPTRSADWISGFLRAKIIDRDIN